MAENETFYLSILEDEQVKKISPCEDQDAANREIKQAIALNTLIKEISTSLAPYFKLVGRLIGSSNDMRHLAENTKRDGTDNSLERLVAAGLVKAQISSTTRAKYISNDFKNKGYESERSLTSYLKKKGDYVKGPHSKMQYEFTKADQIVGIFEQIQSLAASGALFLNIQTPFGLGVVAQRSDNKVVEIFNTFMKERIDIFVENIKEGKGNKPFSSQLPMIMQQLLIGLGSDPGQAFEELTKAKGPSTINHFSKISIAGAASFVILLRDSTNSSLVTKIRGATRNFLNSLYSGNSRRLLFSGDPNNLHTFKDRLHTELKRECKKSPLDDLGKVNKTVGSTQEKRLKNLRCILPMFEDAYSTKRGPAGLENTTNLAPFGVKDIAFDLQSSMKSRSDPGIKLNQEHYKADQFPLLYANTKHSHFFINRLLSQDQDGSQLQSFLEITNADVSKLMPKIQIFKIKYDQNRNEIEIPIEFSNKTEITAGGNYLRENAGIRKVSFTRTGQNPATVDRYLTCRVSLFFDSINSFLKPRKASNGKEYAYIDFLRRTAEYNPISSDKIRSQTAYKQALSNMHLGAKEEDFSKMVLGKKNDYGKDLANKFNELALSDPNGDYFQIKINLGWAINPNLYAGTAKDVKTMQSLNKFISSTNLTLYLTLMSHNFTFGNDGTLSLDLSYMGRLQQKIREVDANIFSDHGLEERIKSASVIGQVISALRGESNQAGVAQEILNLGRLKSSLMTQIEAGKDDLRGQVWETLVNEDGNMVKLNGSKPSETTVPTHILKGTLDEEFLGSGNAQKKLNKKLRDFFRNSGRFSRDDVVLNPGEMLHYAQTRLLTDSKAAEGLKIKQVFRNGKNYTGQIRNHAPNPGPQTKKALEKQNQKRDKPKVLFGRNRKFSFYMIRFGSVIQAAVQNIWNNNPQALESVGVLMGPIKFRGLDGTTRYTNICHIPILLSDWKAFMARNVVAKDRTTYSLLHYIRDAVNELLIPALGHECKDNERLISPLKNVKIKATTISARRNPDFKVQPQKDNSSYKTMQIDIDKKFSGNKAKKPILSKKLLGDKNVVSPLKGDLKHYIVLYDGGSSDAALSAGTNKNLYKKNISNNIPHFFIGANKGILKTVGFKKTDIQFLQEARVIDHGDTDFGLLREKYDCNLSVVGSPHFTQGMKLYIDPTLTGFSNSDYMGIVQRDLGLGGYYDIIGVTSTIDAQSFDTEIQTSWVAFGPDPKKK